MDNISILKRKNGDGIDENKNLFMYQGDHFHGKDELSEQSFLPGLIKPLLLLGADKLLMARKSPCLHFDPHDDNEENTSQKTTEHTFTKYASKQKNKVPRSARSSPHHFDKTVESRNAYQFPLNIIIFLAVLMLKLVGFQTSLCLRFFTFPIRVLSFWLMFLMFPFQTMNRIKDDMKKMLLRAFKASYSSLISFICDKFASQKSLLKLAMRFGKAFFCSVYVFFVLLGLLVSGFAIGGILMRNFVQEPKVATETLNFDYTKTSPAAVVPISASSSLVTGVSSYNAKKISGSGSLVRRATPYNHKMRLTVSLTLPESDYNRNLGIFQVRVESLSATGKVITGSSYPTMLRFKSHPIRLIETLLKSVPLITGLQSEVQKLKIAAGDFTEGYEPTASFRVILEQRAEFQAGSSGVPEIYAASLDIATELPAFKRIVWNWRRTIFVWVGITSFMGEMMIVLLFCRPFLLPGGISGTAAKKKKSQLDKVPYRKVN